MLKSQQVVKVSCKLCGSLCHKESKTGGQDV